MPLHLPVSPQQSTRLRVPPDPQATVDALLLAALAVGESRVDRLALNPDIDAFLLALQALGVRIAKDAEGGAMLHGVGITGFLTPSSPLAVSRASLPLLLGGLAGHAFDSILTCDDAPVKALLASLLAPLAAMGVAARHRPEPGFPLLLEGRSDLMPVDWHAEGSADDALLRTLLLAGLHAPGTTSLKLRQAPAEPLLAALGRIGARIEATQQEDGCYRVAVEGRPDLRHADWVVAGDTLLAACLVVTAACTPGAQVILESVPSHPAMTGLIRALEQAGATIETLHTRACYGGCMTDLAISGALPVAIDTELPAPGDLALLLAAGLARGRDRSALRGIGEDPILGRRAARLAACGVAIDVVGDDLVAGGAQAHASAGLDACDDGVLAAAFLTSTWPAPATLAGPGTVGELALSCLRRLFINARDERHS